MADEQTLAEQIAENAVADKTVVTDGLTSTQHSIADQILAAKYLDTNAAVKKPRGGLSYQKLKPPGSV